MKLSNTKASVEEKPMVADLLRRCLRSYSADDPTTAEDDRSTGYPWFDLYWSSAHRQPYLFRFESRLAGFGFVRQRDDHEAGDWRWQIAEFFVVHDLRRQNIGTAAALELLRGRLGVWEFAYDMANEPARLFWRKVALNFGIHTPIAVAEGRECYRVCIDQKRANKAPEPTPGSVTPRATHESSK
jgi:predicted acetyltransferase